jgi:two-component system response regulator NreC
MLHRFLYEKSSAARSPRSQGDRRLVSARIRVLLVDDHKVVRIGLRMLIERQEDMEVAGEAATAGEALLLARSQQPDVALVDLTLGTGSGIELIRELQEAAPATRSVALAMHDDTEHLRLVLAAGGSGYVPKQAPPDEVLSAIRLVAQGRAFFSLSLEQLRAGQPGASPGRAVAAELLARLTPREREILRLIALGLTHGEIAAQLGISLKTVETHRQHTCDKLGIRPRALLVRFAQQSGLLDGDEC